MHTSHHIANIWQKDYIRLMGEFKDDTDLKVSKL